MYTGSQSPHGLLELVGDADDVVDFDHCELGAGRVTKLSWLLGLNGHWARRCKYKYHGIE